MNKPKIVYLSYVLAFLSVVLPMRATQADVAGVFSKGQTLLSIYGGTGYAFNEDYFVIGVSANYFLINGLNIGLAYEAWTGSTPKINKLTPSINYVFYQPQSVKPYIGAFYRHTYIENLPDLESVGGRLGIYIHGGRNVYIGLGGVYESYLDCTETVYNSCDDTYPEISFTFAF